MGQIDRGEIQLSGKDGFLQQIIRAGLERGLEAELKTNYANIAALVAVSLAAELTQEIGIGPVTAANTLVA